MADTKFDAKSFNPEAFGKYLKNVPNLKRNELIKSRALTGNADIRNMFSSQTGTYYGRIPMFGDLDGDAQNYDGNTDLVSTSTTTYEQGVVVFGRMKSWEEKDFSYDITGGVDFMSNVAKQVSAYWEDIDQGVLLSILNGIFSMTGAENLKFVNGHTLDITGKTGEDAKVGAGSLNTVAQQACGDNKSAFSLCIMHSAVATNLENLKLFKYLTYTDANGIERELSIGTWNGRSVLIDDAMPTEEADGGIKYTTYVLGDGAFAYENIGAKVPYEMTREALKAGGKDILISRQRKVLAPKGISFKMTSGVGTSPTNEVFANGASWELVHDAQEAKKVYNHKGIPIARIVSLG